MRISVWPNAAQSWEAILGVARHAEASGWDGVWVADHFMPNSATAEGPTHEAWALVAGLAAAVPRVRIGTLVCGNTYRHPAVLAKQAASADHVSGGRIVLGLGAGWQENEHRAYGIPFFTVKERLDRLEEACEIVTSLWAQERTSFKGTHYELTDAPLSPKPVQERLPLLVGGRGEKRTMRIAARFADEWNAWTTPDDLRHKNEVLDRHCADLGRDPSSIRRSTQALVVVDPSAEQRRQLGGGQMPVVIGSADEITETLGRYADAGCDEFIVPDFAMGGGTSALDALDKFSEAAAPFRA